MIRALLDTNVLASAIAGAGVSASTPGELLRRWEHQEYRLVLCEPLLVELGRALSNPYFSGRLSPAQVERALQTLRRRAELTPITASVSGVASHPEDDLILAGAVSARVDYLVTGDRQLHQLRHYQGVTILGPRVFRELLDRARSTEL